MRDVVNTNDRDIDVDFRIFGELLFLLLTGVEYESQDLDDFDFSISCRKFLKTLLNHACVNADSFFESDWMNCR